MRVAVEWRVGDIRFQRKPENEKAVESAWQDVDSPEWKWRVTHGDCLDVMARLPAGSVDAVVTSPPYNQLGSRIPSQGTGCISNRGFIDKVNRCGYSDDMEEPAYIEWLGVVVGEIARIMRPGGSFFFNHKIRYRDCVPLHPWDVVTKWPGFSVRQEIVWDRRKSLVFNARMFAPSDERIYWLVRDGADYDWNDGNSGLLSVWVIPANAQGIEHPCPMPVAVARSCLSAVVRHGMLVLDPFMGSGTTGVACIEEGVRFHGIERESEYVRIACARIEAAASQGRLPFARAGGA